MSESKETKSGTDWAKLLSAIGAVVAAVAALLTALDKVGVVGPRTTATAPTQPSAVAVSATAITVSRAARLVLLEDDFSDPLSGWQSEVDPEAEWGYEGGKYRAAVYAPDLAVWGNPKQLHNWTDFSVEVQAQASEGPADNQYGVQVRYQPDGDNFYLFVVSSDGMYAAQMYRDGEWIDLVPWSRSSAVRQGNAANHLRVECHGSAMRLIANAELLATVQDATFASGDIGLLAGSYDQGGVVVLFDKLIVRSLP